MDKNTFNERMTAVGTCDDDVQRRELISNLITEVGADYDNMAELSTQNENYKNDNEALRKANMDLFLKVGSKNQDDKEDTDPGDNEEVLKYEDLFNEKGELK